ncbi:hypothetical protein ACH19I_06210 [Yersinia kristensenii]|uniref:hypothetical protein n=1 Tax=Yersinia kristensenii TaxID=28152 RepID=UPI003896E2B6
MKEICLTKIQLLRVLKEVESSQYVKDVVETEVFWRPITRTEKSKYAGMGFSDIKRMKGLEEEDRQLKQMYISRA